MKIIVDENISFAKEAFTNFGEVVLMSGRQIDNNALKSADALITRSVTKVDEKLLSGTKVKFCASATIGLDHYDTEYLDSAGIKYASAPGCNSQAVAEYVFSGLVHLAIENDFKLKGMSIGIVGVGNIGKKVETFARDLGMKVLLNDPPRQREEGDIGFVSLETALQADIITMHVPLVNEGIDKTFHLINEDNIDLISEEAVFINACRGPVVDNGVLFERIINYRDLMTILDVWEPEPNINKSLLEVVDIATPHIAGYSLEGKVNGTKMVYDELAEFLGREASWVPQMPDVENNIIICNKIEDETEKLYKIMNSVYPILDDSNSLKKAVDLASNEVGNYFDSLRKNYPLRREMNNFILK